MPFMTDFNKNNLAKSLSPYLQQHKDNPIHWQEWSHEVVDYAKKNNKLIFISVGYSACHWCHVMAQEAFSDNEVAKYLNENFISVKIDREQRPDIDQFLMYFLTKTQGVGGWPLNAFLTYDLRPVFALTYIPLAPKHGMPSFMHVLVEVHEAYKNFNGKFSEFSFSQDIDEGYEEDALLENIMSQFDEFAGGFGVEPKFPPYNTLLFLLSFYEKTRNEKIKNIIEKTLYFISTRGLHDHFQGGFFRYCVDASWSVPHFEKMLYDQAMLLWVYSAAYKVFHKEEYKVVADKIIKCLEETFEHDNLFFSSLDADTDHEEGKTYLWTLDELKNNLTKGEFDKFSEIYEVNENFEGKIHLIKKNDKFLPEIEEKLLKIRKTRNQPFIDRKIITSWNSLVCISLMMNYRYIGNENSKNKAIEVFEKLSKDHYVNGKLFHSSLNKQVQKYGFLEDYAAFLLLVTYIYEETGNYRNLLDELIIKISKFKKNEWIENINTDFVEIPAQSYDHPIPSSVSMAEFAVLRTDILLNKVYLPESYKSPLNYDFYNLMVFVKNGNYHIIYFNELISWYSLPLNSIQVKSSKIQDCYNKMCVEFKNVKELLDRFH